MKLRNYDEIGTDYKESLILGNGASIAVSSSFSYKSLLEQADKYGFVSKNASKVFNFFSTTDIEFVLRHLWFAQKINKYLSVIEQKTNDSYKEVKMALIKTVLANHPKPSVVDMKTDVISSFIGDFKKVFYLNYDLLLYWSLIKFNELNRGNRIKDCFYMGHFSEDWTYYEAPRPPVSETTLVFYPHGNLCLLKSYDEEFMTDEQKIESGNELLLDKIVSKWKKPNSMPLFISEGTWKQKLNSIDSSSYLSEVYYSIFPKAGDGITIYGWAASEQDDHILKALKRAKVKKIAMSVHIPTTPDIDGYCRQVEQKFKKTISKNIQIEFFDAESKGCWVY